jgi:hypothetical protein
VGLVLGQHDRAVGQVAELPVQLGQNLVAAGVAARNQTGPPPAGDLADPSAQGALAELGSAEPLPQPGDRPRAGLVQQPQDALAKPGAAQPRPAGPRPAGQPASAVGVVAVDPAAHRRRIAAQQAGDHGRRQALAGQQDHDQAAGDAVRAVEQPEQVAGATRRAGGFGVHAAGTRTGGGLVGSAVLWKAPAPREAASIGAAVHRSAGGWSHAVPRDELLATMRSVSGSRRRGRPPTGGSCAPGGR